MDEPEASTQKGRGRETADLNAAAIVSGCTVDISGVAVGLRASDEARAAVLAAALGRLAPHSGPPDAWVSFDRAIPPLPETPPDESYAGRFHVWRRREELYLRCQTDAAGRVTAESAEFGGLPTPAFRHLVPLALAHLLAFRDLFVLHAGVIERGDRVALLIGDSGAGKSTLAIASLQSGWRVLSDDLALVGLDAGHILATTFSLPLAFPVDWPDEPVSGSRPLAGDPRGRWTLPVESDSRFRRVTELVLVHRDTAPNGSTSCLDAMATFEVAVGAFLAVGEPLLLRRYLPTASALSRLRGRSLGLAPDPAIRLATAAGHLDTPRPAG